MKKIIFLIGFMLIGAGILKADSAAMNMNFKGTPEFERLKTLAGHWTGTAKGHEGETNPVTVDYKVTSGGNAVVETIDSGKPHEMTSVYFEDQGKVKMTHYCMVGNRPTLALKSATADKLEFDFDPSTVLNSKDETHMHALILLMPKEGELIHQWEFYEKGKSKGLVVFTLTKQS